MPISIMCECGRQFETLESNAGRRAQCPGCGHVMTLPKPASPLDVLFLLDEPALTATSGKAIASLALGVLFFFACLSGVPAILLGRQALTEIDRNGGRLRGRKMAVAGIVLGVIGCLFTLSLLFPAVRSAREAARHSRCVNNLRQIGLAMHKYKSTHGGFPPAAITDKNGQPLLSWRVALLPYIETGPIVSKFHLDEPWDSPHNLSLLSQMPHYYACPSDTTLQLGMTGYQVVVGPDTAFTPDFKPMKLEVLSDDISETILVVETHRAVPWTKPDDLPFDPSRPLTGLGSHHGYDNDGFNVLFGDGSVQYLNSAIGPNVLRALLTRSWNEAISPEND